MIRFQKIHQEEGFTQFFSDYQEPLFDRVMYISKFDISCKYQQH